MEYFDNLLDNSRAENNIYFYWISGHNSDINGFYKGISDFIYELEKANCPYISLNNSKLQNPLTVDNGLSEVWKNNIYIFKDFEIEFLNDREIMTKFLRNFIVFMNLEKTTLNLLDLEVGLVDISRMFIKIFYKQYYVEKSKETFMSRFKGFIFKCIYWHNNVIYNTLTSFDLKNNKTIEKIIFYDEIKTEQLLFLCYLKLIGFDVLAIDTTGSKPIRDVHVKMLPLTLIEYDYKSSPKEFNSLIIKKDNISSIAVQATNEISAEIFSATTGIFKPRQLSNFKVKPILFKTIFEELNSVIFQEIRFREGFEILKDTVVSPQIFLKIDGVSSNNILENSYLIAKFYDKKYFEWTINNLPFGSFNLISECIENREVSFSTILNNFDLHLGNKIKRNIEIVCDVNSFVWNSQNEFVQNRKTQKIIESTIKYLLLENNYIHIIKKIDMPFINPKIVLNEIEFNFKKLQSNNLDNKIIISAMLAFSFLIGMDVLVFSFPCDAIFENLLAENFYQKIILKEVYSYIESEDLINSIKQQINKKEAERPKGVAQKFLSMFVK